MVIIIIMCCSIWVTRNGWTFNNIAPTVQRCRETFTGELWMVVHRTKERQIQNLKQWLEDSEYPYFSPFF
jgi:hypothetical protein